MAASRIQQRSRSPSPPTSRAPYTSSPSRMGGSASRSLSGGTEHYYGAAASIGAPTDFTASLFKDDPAAFKKVEAKLLEYKQKLATATTRAEMLAKENASTKATVIRLEKETHKLSIDAHASAARAQALAAELASEKRDRADERASHAAELSALRTQMRGGNTQRGAAERDVESLRADVARLSADRDDARRDVAALSVNIAGLQATVAAVERRLTVAMQERDRAVLERNDGEAARIELEGQVRRLVGTSRAVEATRDEVMEELRYLQSMVHEERSKRLEAEVVVEEERKRRVLAELLEE
ncbi:hypothetical protein BC828DRAFT_6143 [Blastocladiella britannica]|nr:hypothetical protein BC828DRAFT_6143 [Blastocladiella britannica]